jgi:membrane-associated phospholipid phosphatase
MKQRIIVLLAVLCVASYGFSQDSLSQQRQDTVAPKVAKAADAPTEQKRKQIYKLRPAVDIPLTVAAAAWSGYNLAVIYDKEPSSQEQILALDKNNLNIFDRWAADVWHPSANKTSDIFFYGSMAVPVLLLFDHDIRSDAGKVGFMFLQAMSFTGALYTTSTYVNRYRPYAYNENVPMSDRQSGNAKNSFFAGHVALVATTTFFTAKVFSDYHPDWKGKWVLYTAAAGATLTTGYLRHRAGKHFPTDILVGTTVGTLSGILVPQMHKNRAKNSRLTFFPYFGEGQGIAMLYKL